MFFSAEFRDLRQRRFESSTRRDTAQRLKRIVDSLGRSIQRWYVGFADLLSMFGFDAILCLRPESLVAGQLLKLEAQVVHLVELLVRCADEKKRLGAEKREFVEQRFVEVAREADV